MSTSICQRQIASGAASCDSMWHRPRGMSASVGITAVQPVLPLVCKGQPERRLRYCSPTKQIARAANDLITRHAPVARRPRVKVFLAPTAARSESHMMSPCTDAIFPLRSTSNRHMQARVFQPPGWPSPRPNLPPQLPCSVAYHREHQPTPLCHNL